MSLVLVVCWFVYILRNEMASALPKESEEFITCRRCYCEFNELVHRPKFLPCSHSVCLPCLEELWSNDSVICPVCSHTIHNVLDLTCFPNNLFALHIIKFQAKKAAAVEVPRTEPVPVPSRASTRWCLTCGSSAKQVCSTLNHSCILNTAATLKNFEALLKLRDDARSKFQEKQIKLAEAIQQRREIQVYLFEVSQALALFASDLAALEEENNNLIAELVSLSEDGGPENQEKYWSDLMDSFFTDLNQVDTVESLREKLNAQNLVPYQDKLDLAAAQFTEIDNQKRVKTTVKLLNESGNPIPCWKRLEEGFSVMWDQPMGVNKRDFILLSHITYAINNRIKRQNKTSLSSCTVPLSESPAQPSPVASPSAEKFVLRIFKAKNAVGQINIQPLISSPCLPFIKQLGKCCRKANLVSAGIDKALADVFVLVSFVAPPSIASSLISSFIGNPQSHVLAKEPGDVGVTLFKTKGNRVTHFSLVFPLGKFNDPINKAHVRVLAPALLLGQIKPSGLGCLNKIGLTKNSERSQYKLKLSFE